MLPSSHHTYVEWMCDLPIINSTGWWLKCGTTSNRTRERVEQRTETNTNNLDDIENRGNFQFNHSIPFDLIGFDKSESQHKETNSFVRSLTFSFSWIFPVRIRFDVYCY